MTDPRRAQRPRVAAIVPAYNEGGTLADVLSVLIATPWVDEVLVVSDGSTDATVEIARRAGARTIHLRENRGKATAMAIGVEHTRAELLLFVDGDIQNLSQAPFAALIEPVAAGRAGMCIGLRHRGRAIDAFHRRFGPHLSGIRSLRREVFAAVPARSRRGFAIETGLNWTCRRLGLPIETVLLYDLKHLVKEKKRGLVAGAIARLHMFAAVFSAWLALALDPPPLARDEPPQAPQAAPPNLDLEVVEFQPTP